MSKVAIVGMGRVGAAFGYKLGTSEIVDTIYAIDYNQELATMQVKDLQEAFIIDGSKTRIEVSNYTDMSDVDLVVITAGAPVTKVVDRLELFDKSMEIAKSIVNSCLAANFNGMFLIASNPVDIITAVVAKESGFEHQRVIGSGTILDNARLIYELSKELNVDPKFIKSDCIGEHGNSIVPLYSEITINNQPLEEYLTQNDIVINFDKLTEKVTTGGPAIFKVKGATEFGIASSLARITNAILNDTNEVLTVTNKVTVPDSDQLYIPAPATVNKEGYSNGHIPAISKVEMDQLIHSYNVLKEFNKLIK